MTPILTALGVVGVFAAAIGIGIMVIRAKLNSATKRYLGMNLQQTADLIGKGLKDEVSRLLKENQELRDQLEKYKSK